MVRMVSAQSIAHPLQTLTCQSSFLFTFDVFSHGCRAGLTSHGSSSAECSQTLPAHEVKPEPLQFNGPSHSPSEAPPPPPQPPLLLSLPVPVSTDSDSNSNGCGGGNQPAAPNHERNGVEPPLEHKESAPVASERPPKRCRTEAESLGPADLEATMGQEN